MLAGIVTAVTEIVDKKIRYMCQSTEDMCQAIKEVNKMTDIKNLVLFSTNISAMYPSLDVPEVAQVAADLWDEFGLELNLDTEEIRAGASPAIMTKEVLRRQP